MVECMHHLDIAGLPLLAVLPPKAVSFLKRGGFLASQGETRILSIAPSFGSVKVPADHENIVVDQMTKNDLNVK